MALATITLGDVQAFSDSLAGLAHSSDTRTLATVKSLLAFGQRTGYPPLNVGAAVKLEQSKDKLAERTCPSPTVERTCPSPTVDQRIGGYLFRLGPIVSADNKWARCRDEMSSRSRDHRGMKAGSELFFGVG